MTNQVFSHLIGQIGFDRAQTIYPFPEGVDAQTYAMQQMRAQTNMHAQPSNLLFGSLLMNCAYPRALAHGPRVRSTAYPNGKRDGI